MPDTSQSAAPAKAQAALEYHWVMTVQTSDMTFNTRTAVITVPVGFTRAAAFEFVFKQFKADYGSPLTVLFFDLQSNAL